MSRTMMIIESIGCLITAAILFGCQCIANQIQISANEPVNNFTMVTALSCVFFCAAVLFFVNGAIETKKEEITDTESQNNTNDICKTSKAQ